MFYLQDYKQFAADYVDDENDFDLDAIADELRDALNGESPDTMDQDEFTAIIERNQR